MALDRNAISDVRQRRAFQQLVADPFGAVGLTAGQGIVFNSPATGNVSVSLATNAGLAFTGNKLTVFLDTNPGIVLSGSGMKILLDPASTNLLTLSASGLLAKSPLTTKGDIYTRTSSGDARLPVGTDGKLLVADSTQATGLNWITFALPFDIAYYDVNNPWSVAQTFINDGIKLKGAGAGVLTFEYANTASSWTVKVPDPGFSGQEFVLTAATQTINGLKTFGQLVTFNVAVQHNGDIGIDATGSSTGAPRSFGVSSMPAGTAARCLFADAFNCFQLKPGGRFQLNGYNGIEINGGHQSGVMTFTTAVAGEPNVIITGEQTANPMLGIYPPSSQTGDLTQWYAAGSTSTINSKVDSGGNIVTNVAGVGYKCKEGTNACMGTAVLVGGTVVVNTTKVTANSRIFLTAQAPGGTVGAVYVSARTAGTSFTITSTNGLDTSTVAWFLVEPS